MKKLKLNLFIMFVASGTLLFNACNKDDNDLIVNPGMIVFTSNAGSKEVVVENAKNFDVSTDASWIHLSKSTNSFTVSVDKHTAIKAPSVGNGRTGIVTVTSGSKQFFVAVQQAPLYYVYPTNNDYKTAVIFTLDELATRSVALSVDAPGGPLSGIAQWDFSVSGGDWLTVAKGTGNALNLTPKDLNKGTEMRTATITLSAIEANDFTFEVKQEVWIPFIQYNSAEVMYYGDAFDSGSASFKLNLFDAANNLVGLFIEGFATLPEDGSDFELELGRYYLGEEDDFGITRTFIGGDTEEEGATGSYLILSGGSKILITGGTFTVAYSKDDDEYTITTYLTGIDADKKPVNHIRYQFVGNIVFEDKTK